MDLIYFGQQNWDVCWTGKQHYCTRLARRGHRVLYVDPDPPCPTGAVTALNADTAPRPRTSIAQLQRREPIELDHRLWRLCVPPRTGRFRRWGDVQRQRFLLRAVKQLGLHAPLIVVSYPHHPARFLGLRGTGLIYFGIDEWTGFSDDPGYQQHVRRREEALLDRSDLALAVSQRLLDRFIQRQPRSYLQRNGVDTQRFGPARLAALPGHSAVAALLRPRLVYVGQVDGRIDGELVATLARRRPDWQFVFVGRVTDACPPALRDLPNVHLPGHVNYADVPRVLREADVCIAPYARNPLTEACSPLKVFEYLATGRPTIATRLPGTQAVADVVPLPTEDAAWETAIADALADPTKGERERLRAAAENDWEGRTDLFEQRLIEAREAAMRGRPRVRRRLTLPGRKATPSHVALDAKEASIRIAHPRAAPSLTQRLLFDVSRLTGAAAGAVRRLCRLLRGRPARIRRILVVRQGCLGDLIAILPMLAALRRRFPDARIVLGVGSNMKIAQSLLADSACVDRVDVLAGLDQPGLPRLRAVWQLANQRFDLLITGHSYFFFSAALYCGAPLRVGLYDGHPVQRWLTRAVPLDATRHEADNNLALAEALGAVIDPADRAPRLDLSPQRLDAAARQLASLNGRANRNRDDATLITIHAGSKRPTRRWPAERFTELIDRLLTQFPDAAVALTGVGDEAEVTAAIRDAVSPDHRAQVHDLTGKTSLDGLIALLDRSRLIVTNDTATLHLARARNRPLLALLGPENDRRWGPYQLSNLSNSSNSSNAQDGAAPAIAIRHATPCAPCERWECAMHACMASLSVDEAFDAACTLLTATDAQGDNGCAASLHTRTKRHDWNELAAAGFALPAVTAVVLPDGASATPGGDACVVNDWLNRQRETYPHVEAVDIAALPGNSLAADVLACASTGLILLVKRDRLPPAGAVSEAVAILQRCPSAQTVIEGEQCMHLTRAALDAVDRGKALLARREALAALAADESRDAAAENTEPEAEPELLPTTPARRPRNHARSRTVASSIE